MIILIDNQFMKFNSIYCFAQTNKGDGEVYNP